MNRKSDVLDKSSPIPLYYQLADHIRAQIEAGRLTPGDQLPAERDLSKQVGVSRMTARQAITYLIREGILISKQGVGTFVPEPKLTHGTLHLLGFTEEMMRQGGEVGSRVLEQGLILPPLHVATQLAISSDDSVVKIVRLRMVEHVPILLETSFVPASLCPDLQKEDLEKNSLYSLLENKYGLILQRCRQTIEAMKASDYESELFGVPVGTAMIALEGLTYQKGGDPVEFIKGVYRGDRFKFEFVSERLLPYEALTSPRLSITLMDHD